MFKKIKDNINIYALIGIIISICMIIIDTSRRITFHYGSLSLVRTDTNKIIASCGNKKEIDRFITICECATVFEPLK